MTLGVAALPVATALNTPYQYRLQAIGPDWALSRDHGPGTPVARLLTGTLPVNQGIGHIGFTAYQATVHVDSLEISSGVPIAVELAGTPIAQRTWGAYAVFNTPGQPIVDPTVSDDPEWVTTMFSRIGGTPEIASWYATSSWSSMPDAAAIWASSGLSNMVAWVLASPLTASGIQGGSIDAQMLSLSAAIDALPTPTWIRLCPEMNVSTSPAQGVATTPGRVRRHVAAHRPVHARADLEGALHLQPGPGGRADHRPAVGAVLPRRHVCRRGRLRRLQLRQ